MKINVLSERLTDESDESVKKEPCKPLYLLFVRYQVEPRVKTNLAVEVSSTCAPPVREEALALIDIEEFFSAFNNKSPEIFVASDKSRETLAP